MLACLMLLAAVLSSLVMFVTIAFYKGRGLKRDRLIRWWTKSRYSHVELILPDGNISGIRPPYYSLVTTRAIKKLNESEWDLLEVEVSNSQLGLLQGFIASTEGQGYDWLGMIASNISPLKVRAPGRWYCSEWVAYALSVSGVLPWKFAKLYDLKSISPADLYVIINNMGKTYEKDKSMYTWRD